LIARKVTENGNIFGNTKEPEMAEAFQKFHRLIFCYEEKKKEKLKLLKHEFPV